jgi:hypothetical protein
LDPDSAVVRSTTGHQVQKKREWFIWYKNKHYKSTHTATNVCLNNILQLSHLFVRINYLCLNLSSHRAKTSRKRPSQEAWSSYLAFHCNHNRSYEFKTHRQ